VLKQSVQTLTLTCGKMHYMQHTRKAITLSVHWAWFSVELHVSAISGDHTYNPQTQNGLQRMQI
jgi:hypothetical protein